MISRDRRTRLALLERQINSQKGEDEEMIIHVCFYGAPGFPDPDYLYPGDGNEFPPVEEQIAEHRERGEKCFIVFSIDSAITQGAAHTMTGEEYLTIGDEF